MLIIIYIRVYHRIILKSDMFVFFPYAFSLSLSVSLCYTHARSYTQSQHFWCVASYVSYMRLYSWIHEHVFISINSQTNYIIDVCVLLLIFFPLNGRVSIYMGNCSSFSIILILLWLFADKQSNIYYIHINIWIHIAHKVIFRT